MARTSTFLVVLGSLLANAIDAGGADAGRVRFVWADFHGDTLEDVYVVRPEEWDSLFRNLGDGSFEDVTATLPCVSCASVEVAWRDVDGDGDPDLLRLLVSGTAELFENRGDGVFADVTGAAGLDRVAATGARWLDYDTDGRADIQFETEGAPLLFHNLGDFLFEPVTLDGGRRAARPEAPSTVRAVPGALNDRASRSAAQDDDAGGSTRSGVPALSGPLVDEVHPDPLVPGTPPFDPLEPRSDDVDFQLPPFANRCAWSVRDTSTGDCVLTSTLPTFGKLYPISANLFVSTSGDVGIGTTSPATKLEVAGTARITDTLTLAPSGDQALDVSTGSIYKGGALFIHTKGGANNTAMGRNALANVTSGYKNTASGSEALYTNGSGARNTANGYAALRANTTGFDNTASGYRVLFSNTSGYYNTASGFEALRSNTTGHRNTASGFRALVSNTTGIRNTACGFNGLRSNTIGINNTACGFETLFSNTTGITNTACGFDSLFNNTTGSRNTGLGFLGGFNLTTGSDNIAINNEGVAGEGATIRIGTSGTQTRAFIAGIRGVTTGVANAIPVLVDSAGQLGTVSSSRRFKEDITDMGDTTRRLLDLRPVTFRYKADVQQGERPVEYGLIAEEVAEVFPDLVVYDESGEPFTVKYHLLASMLLNELKENDARDRERERELEQDLADLREELTDLEAFSPRSLPASVPASNL